MRTYSNNQQLASRAAADTKTSVAPVHVFADNRPETLRQRAVQKMADEYVKATTMKGFQPTPSRNFSGMESRQPVQRHAFVKGKHLNPNDKSVDLEKDLGFTPGMMVAVHDNKIRDFESVAEFDNYVQSKTDYIGNLEKDGTWLRFDPKGLNGIGENHTEIVLSDTLKAVDGLKGGKWVHEKFSDVAEEVGKDSLTNKKLTEEHAGVYEDYKMGKETDETPHAAESVLPKLGYGLTLILDSYNAGGMLKLDGLKSGGYTGKPLATIFQMCWYYGRDVIAMEQQKAKTIEKYKIPPHTETLILTMEKTRKNIEPLAEGIKYGEFLGDKIDEKNVELRTDVIEFAKAMTDHLVFIKSEDTTGTVSSERKEEFRKAASPAEKYAVFARLRNDRFLALVQKAKDSGYRYAGMGNAHLAEAPMRKLLGEDHCFDMTSKGVSHFNKSKQYTELLKSKI